MPTNTRASEPVHRSKSWTRRSGAENCAMKRRWARRSTSSAAAPPGLEPGTRWTRSTRLTKTITQTTGARTRGGRRRRRTRSTCGPGWRRKNENNSASMTTTATPGRGGGSPRRRRRRARRASATRRRSACSTRSAARMRSGASGRCVSRRPLPSRRLTPPGIEGSGAWRRRWRTAASRSPTRTFRGRSTRSRRGASRTSARFVKCCWAE
mmetsp:Transcript_12394/g.57355  ORF Transcript_12394/g.57355 Transcript_12394/m.57355 type:complete len:210 (-) Transcript_12394:291-920(-)